MNWVVVVRFMGEWDFCEVVPMPDRQSFRTWSQIASDLPDGRLFTSEFDPGRRLFIASFMEGFVHPEAVSEFEELGRHLLRGGLLVDGGDGGLPLWLEEAHRQDEPFVMTGVLEARMERSDHIRAGRAVGLKRVGPRSIMYVVRRELIRPEITREWNEVAEGLIKAARLSP